MSAFTDAVARTLAGIDAVSVGAAPGCELCGLAHIEDANDDVEAVEIAEIPSFSWMACDSCGAPRGGDRHPMHGLIDGELWHGTCCTDCLIYHANGEEPDDWSW